MNLISYLKTSWYRFSNLWRFQYRTVWTENLPEKLIKKTIYILGGRKCPFQVVYLCPRNCNRDNVPFLCSITFHRFDFSC